MASDDFNRANGALGSNWSVQTGDIQISSNAAVPITFEAASVAHWVGSTVDGNESEFTVLGVEASNDRAGALCRGVTGQATGYFVSANNARNRANLFKIVSGTLTLIGYWINLTIPDGTRLAVRSTDSGANVELRCLFNGSVLTSEVVAENESTGSMSGVLTHTSNVLATSTISGIYEANFDTAVARIDAWASPDAAASNVSITATPSDIQADAARVIVIDSTATTPTPANTDVHFDDAAGPQATVNSVTPAGGDSYLLNITFPISTIRQFDPAGYPLFVDVNGDSDTSAAVPYIPESGSETVAIVSPNLVDTANLYYNYIGTAPVTGDQGVFTSVTTPDGVDINVDADGTVHVMPITQTNTMTYRVIQADGTVGPDDIYTFLFGGSGNLIGKRLSIGLGIKLS